MLDRSRARLLLAALALAGCKSEAPQPDRNPAGDPAQAQAPGQAPGQAPAQQGDLLTPYLDIGEQLAADHNDGLGPSIEAVRAAASTKSGEPGVEAMLAAAAKIPAADLEATRAAYRDLSHALLDWLDAHPDAREGLHLAYCPMAFDNHGGYWVARTAEINNPYEGSRMLHCGASLHWDEGVEHRKRWAAAQAQP